MSLKLQCPCGQKVLLEVTEQSAAFPIQFVCPVCGADNSAAATAGVRQEFGFTAPGPAPAPAPGAANRFAAPPPVATEPISIRIHAPPVQAPPTAATSEPPLAPPITIAAPPPPSLAPKGASPTRVKVSVAGPASPAPTETATAAPAIVQTCSKHFGEAISNHCMVCQKPICPKCMEIFGYVCSAFCRSKAEAQKMDIPEYENQRTVSEARFGRKVTKYALAIAAVVALLAGVWAWWEWVATMPKPVFSKTFSDKAFSGRARMSVPNQIVALHGGTLARFDLKTRQEVWSKYLLDKDAIAANASTTLEQMKVHRKEAIADGADPDDLKIPAVEELTESMIRSAEESLTLHAVAENVWVQFPDKIIRYDWQNGAPAKEIPLTDFLGHWTAKGAELVSLSETDAGGRVLTHLDLASGEIKKEEFAAPKKAEPLILAKSSNSAKPATPVRNVRTAPLPAKLNSNQLAMAARLMTNQAFLANYNKAGAKPLDPKEVARQYQNL